MISTRTEVAVDVPRRAFVAQIMGMPISIHLRGPEVRQPAVEAAVERAFAALRFDEEVFSTWKPDSDISRIQRGELSLAAAHPRVREVARLCERATALTGGAFSAQLPGPDGRTVFNPTGLVKGWAVQRALDNLLAEPALHHHDAMINAGGDIAVLCQRTDTPDWTIAVEDPRDRQHLLRTLALRRGAVATSGTVARGRHIIDPATGLPAVDELLSATVIGPSLIWADVYATAAYVRGRRALAWLATIPQHLGLLVTADGTVLTAGANASDDTRH